jgi:hypothetical protein
MKDQPTRMATGRASGTSGTTGRPGPAMLTVQAAPTPAVNPTTANHPSRALRSNRIALVHAPPAGRCRLPRRCLPGQAVL